MIGQEIDESVDHKITAVLTASADRKAKDLGGDYTVNEYSIAYDEILDLKEIELQYHVGGYEDCQEALILLSLDMQQIQMDHQDYLRYKVEKGEIVSDTFTIKAPSEPGAYDLTGWVIKDPFSAEAPEFVPLDAAYRFTVNVCE